MSKEKKFSSVLRGFLSHDGVVGAKERWWAGNKDFDFLTDGDEEVCCKFPLLKILPSFTGYSS
jgi:hypothetical protein